LEKAGESVTRQSNITAQRWSAMLLVFNLIGTVMYVYRASCGWVLPRERGLHSVTGEPFIWALAIFPVCVVFFLLNLTWAAFYSRSEAMANGRPLAVDNSNLAGCSGKRFRAPLVMIGSKSRLTSNPSPEFFPWLLLR
jgi:hypothetical protein